MNITKFVPHRRTMLLIDEIIDSTKENFTVKVIIKETSLLKESGGVPSYAGIEYMAQTIAAYNSFHFKNDDLAKIGFIIAVRSYECHKLHFKVNDVLKVKVNPALIVNNSGSFNCTISLNNETLAKGKITAFVPTKEELQKLKKGSHE